jgi:hypothetical protein
MTLGILLGIVCAVWLMSCGASLLSIYWNLKAGFERRWPARISCGVALLLAYLGLRRIQFHASRTVNGHVEWSFNSKWFFLGALVLAVISLALTLWSWRKAGSPAGTGPLKGGAAGNFGKEPEALPVSGSATPPGGLRLTDGPPSAG